MNSVATASPSFNMSTSAAGLAVVTRSGSEKPLEWYFPQMDPGETPLGARVLVQYRRVNNMSAGGIEIVQETKETQKYHNQVAKVVAMGPICFKNRETGDIWPEREWFKIGDYVRVPRWGGDRFELPAPDQQFEDDVISFAVLMDHEVMTRTTRDPRDVKAFIL